jgi:hypothetical protein
VTARIVRRLLLLAVLLLVGYGLGWADRAYGHAPLAAFLLVAAVSWLAGAAWVTLPLTLAVSEAHRERDLIAARLAQIEDGGTYQPIPMQARR